MGVVPKVDLGASFVPLGVVEEKADVLIPKPKAGLAAAPVPIPVGCEVVVGALKLNRGGAAFALAFESVTPPRAPLSEEPGAAAGVDAGVLDEPPVVGKPNFTGLAAEKLAPGVEAVDDDAFALGNEKRGFGLDSSEGCAGCAGGPIRENGSGPDAGVAVVVGVKSFFSVVGAVEVGNEKGEVVAWAAGVGMAEGVRPKAKFEGAGFGGSVDLEKKLEADGAAVGVGVGSAGFVGLKNVLGTAPPPVPLRVPDGGTTVILGAEVADALAAASSFRILSFSTLALSSLSFSAFSLSCLAFSTAKAFSFSTFSFASVSALSLASLSISFFLLASRTFIIALASSSCFSHFEKTFGPGERGLAFVLSNKPGVGESCPLTDPAKGVRPFRLPDILSAREVDEIRFTVGIPVLPKGEPGRPVEPPREWR